MSQPSAFEIPQNYKIIKVSIDRAELVKVYNDPQIEHDNEKVLDYLTKDYQGVAQFFDIDFDDGKALVSWGVQRGSKEAEDHNKKGLAAAKDKNFQEAIEHWRKAIYINNHDPDTLYNLALAYFEISNFTKSLDKCQEVIENCPVYFRAYFLLGSLYSKMRKFEQAAENIRKGLVFQPDNTTGLVNLGAVLSILKKNHEAILIFERAISLSSTNIKAYLGLGKLYAAQNDVENANRCFKVVIKLDPNGNLGNIAKNSILPEHDMAMANKSEAVITEPSQTMSGDVNELYSHGYQYFLKNDYHTACRFFEKYLEQKDRDAKVWSLLAICQLRSGNQQGAVISIEKALLNQAKNPSLFKQASIIYDACGRAEESRNAAMKAYEMGKHDSVTLTLLGIGKAHAGELYDSAKILQDAVGKNPNNLKARYHLACVLHELRQIDSARQHLEEILWSERETPLKKKARDLLSQMG
ncbi:tetratricopeptide repeat protein [candidate division KSB1 bacterium]|nr:tetratricopeptide repeat protein [candidate division KSB1 bacterium]RQW00380.1 MAG: tetratricopeptide repeat protein [candidate division KSB1 bacterium]